MPFLDFLKFCWFAFSVMSFVSSVMVLVFAVSGVSADIFRKEALVNACMVVLMFIPLVLIFFFVGSGYPLSGDGS